VFRPERRGHHQFGGRKRHYSPHCDRCRDGAKFFRGNVGQQQRRACKYTYFGDANLDGKVDGSDYSLVDSGYGNHRSGWDNGDFNYDGVVDGSDYTLLDNAFNNQGAQIGNSAALIAASTAQVSGLSAVPEPASLD